MRTHPKIPRMTATILIFGDVQAPDFPAWIERHARKLGLQAVTADTVETGLKVVATGPDEMLQALALGCSLGTASVLVDHVTLTALEA